ncbi:hypothetical protein SAMN04487783_2715 [Agrococcus baldri]|uniref:Uncharacterized protein n=1 Tax=Agrococcus baldri TaxID=153730 RepID=A0AA94HPY7_9MICO|nr:hypothetical protein [Agrococcus baldri]SFS18705.1 hypothetical protein SAMN04487783_2715 [Agrococcus baldri]
MLALRTAYNDRAAERHRRAIEESKATPEGRALQREEAIWATAIVVVAIAVVGPSLVVFGSLLLDQQPLAAWAAAVGWGLAAIASFLIAVAGWIGERRLRLGWAFWASLVMAAVAAGHGVLAASWSTS